MLYLHLTIFVVFLNFKHSRSLYSFSDHVNILTSDNFTEFVIDSHQDGKKLQIVHFFAHWCPHCQAFSSTFKQFLSDAIPWSPLIDFSVMSCSVDYDWDFLCDMYNVNGVPRFRLFWFSPNSSDLGIDLVLNLYNATKTRYSVIESISKHWKRGHIPSNWPYFSQLNVDDFNELVYDVDSKAATVVLVEGEGSLLGRELMMHFSGRFTEIRIYRLVYRPWLARDRRTWQPVIEHIDSIKRPFLISINGKQNDFQYFQNIDQSTSDFDYFSSLINHNFVDDKRMEQIW